MKEKPKSNRRWRLLRWGLIGLVIIVTLVATLITEENWRGKHAWEAYEHAAEARGEHLDIHQVISPPVPDAQNFFFAPIVAQSLKATSDTNLIDPLDFKLERGDSVVWPTTGGNLHGQLTDLKQWQTYFRNFNNTPAGKTNGFSLPLQPISPAADILAALAPYSEAAEALRQASLRPYAKLPLDYEQGFEVVNVLFPWFAKEKQFTRFLELRTLAELEAGQPEAALEDVKFSLRIVNSLRDQPLLIFHAVRIAMMNLSLQPIYEGLAQHRWNDAQLTELETALVREDFLADFKLAMRGECTLAIASFETQRITRQMIFPIGDDGKAMATNSLSWTPSAFFYQNELAFARMYENYVLPMADPTNHTVSIAAYRASQNAPELTNRSSLNLYTIQARMSIPAISACVQKFATIQADVDLARAACALERYHLAHNEYPETLAALAPAYIAQLPHDVITGQPLHYRRTDNGKFILYSVGWNEADDGGTTVLTKTGRVDSQQGDWVWQYPAK